jgi:alpha/beta superfamily hydrolase
LHSLPPENDCRLVTLAGAGHFFDDQLDELMVVVTEFATQSVPG